MLVDNEKLQEHITLHHAEINKSEVSLPLDEFHNMVQLIQDLRTQVHSLESANKFLNDQIDDYNEKFTEL